MMEKIYLKEKNNIDGYKIKIHNEAMTKSVIKKLDNLLDKNTRIVPLGKKKINLL